MNTEWKPIASAPKDGSEILVFHPEGGVCAAFCPGEGFAWHCMDGMNTVIGKKSRQSIPAMTSFMEPPTHWMPLPAPPCSTCNDQGAVGNILTAEPCPDCTPAPTSHPIPTGATGEEKDESGMSPYCPECDGGGRISVLSDNSPDAHDVDIDCTHCGGSGSAVDAAKNLARALQSERMQHLQIYGEYKNFHRSLCARFGYGHDPVHFRRDLVSLEEAIAAKVSAPAAGDALARAQMFRHQLAHERAKNERLIAILVGIHNLTLPAPIEVDGKTYVFTPPEAVEIMRGLSDRIRAIPGEIAAIAQQKGEA